MTTMQEAFKNAKPLVKPAQTPAPGTVRKVSQLERVWLWIRDHPRQTNAQYAKVLGTSSGLTILALLDRGMVLTETIMNKNTGRTAKVFWVNPKMGGVYEQWPESGKAREARRKVDRERKAEQRSKEVERMAVKVLPPPVAPPPFEASVTPTPAAYQPQGQEQARMFLPGRVADRPEIRYAAPKVVDQVPAAAAAPKDTQEIPACLQNLTMQESLEAYKYLKKLFG